MSTRTITWEPHMASLGEAVVAIGVFDGVHLGHQALLADTVADAAGRGVASVALTFDRDPDQVVSPQTAAPQLLTLADKIALIGEAGVETVLVVPFTDALAEMSPESFLDSVLLRAVKPLCVHVGQDFRFGHMATGDTGTLTRSGMEHGFEVEPHALIAVTGAPVTSTRIRSVIAGGDVACAAELLGRPTRVSGTVHRGRGEGRGLGFPTANVVPSAFAALPAQGVYAGRAILPDGSQWASAISVGTPPMFPEARDYLEAHIIEFSGDLYDAPLTLEFIQRLRDLESYASVDDLKAAIADDVERSLDIAGFDTEEMASAFAGAAEPDATAQDAPAEAAWEPSPAQAFLGALWPSADAMGDDEDQGVLGDGTPVVDDPAALEAAEQAAMSAPAPFAQEATGEWVTLLDSVTIQGGPDAAARAFEVTSPLDAANIPYAWDPYPPSDRPTGLPGAGVFPTTFAVNVPAERLDDARDALAESASPYAPYAATDDDPASVGDFEEQAPEVDDPAALEAAEQAVQQMRAPGAAARHDEDEWAVLLERMPYDRRRLNAIDHALTAGKIEHVWEPYEPSQAPLIRMPFFGEPTFSVSVFDSDLEAAESLLASLRETDDE